MRLPRRRGEDRERGAVLVESMLVITIILVLFFGILEFGLMLRGRHALAEATRTGARAASSLPRTDGYQIAAAEAVAASLRESIASESVLSLTVFKADPNTGLPVSGTLEACTASCYRFVWDPDLQQFNAVAGLSWPASSQEACGDVGTTDYVGVAITGEHDLVTTFWSDKVKLQDKTIMRLEPITNSAQCS